MKIGRFTTESPDLVGIDSFDHVLQNQVLRSSLGLWMNGEVNAGSHIRMRQVVGFECFDVGNHSIGTVVMVKEMAQLSRERSEEFSRDFSAPRYEGKMWDNNL